MEDNPKDGSIRMIYQGTSTNTTGEGTQTQNNIFNSSYYTNNAGVGYMYESNQVHGLTSRSTIKLVLDAWYQNNLTNVYDKIDGNAGFCGDRIPYSGTGLGITETYYGAYNRLVTNKAPSFECQNDSDLYTTSGSSQGNGALTYPIGLISADEVAYAGGVYNTINESYYLYTGQNFWTMSPLYFYSDYAHVLCVYSIGSLGDGWVRSSAGVRPVINLKADVTISSGDGLASNPYQIN